MWLFMTSPVLMFDFLLAKFLNAQLAMQPRQAKLTLFRDQACLHFPVLHFPID